MPHMANLSWVFLFTVFNMGLLITFFSISFPTMMMSYRKSSIYTSAKKWQW